MSNLSTSELVADKFVDLILMFLGLYAAIAVQDLVDQRKESKQYTQLLEGFTEELQGNKMQRSTVEGKLGNLDKGSDIGEANARFSYFKAEAKHFYSFLECYRDFRMIKVSKKRSPAQQQRFKECKVVLKSKLKVKDPDHLSLSPVYRRDVWRFYLAGGVHLFQEFEKRVAHDRCKVDGVGIKGLAICIGSTYGELSEIEAQVKEIQDLVNDTYFNRQGSLEARFKQFLEELSPYKKRNDAQALAAINRLIDGVIAHIKTQEQAVDQSARVMQYKVKLLKKRMIVLDNRFDVVLTSVNAELDR